MMITPGENMLKSNGLDLRYRVTGRGPALMVQPPGWGIGAGLYEQTLQPLEREFTVIYHDPRGSGRSGAPDDPDDINVGCFVDDLEALRVHLGLESFALMGHSHGGFIALNYALRYPQHLSHLVALDAQLGIAEPGEDMQRTLPELARDPRLTEAAGAFSGPMKLTSDHDVSSLLDCVAPLYFRDPEGEGVSLFREYVRTTRIPLATSQAAGASDGRFLVRDRLDALEVPTLVLVGRHDFICSPVQAQLIHQGIRNSRLRIFEDSGHMPWIDEPDLFFESVTSFLKS